MRFAFVLLLLLHLRLTDAFQPTRVEVRASTKLSAVGRRDVVSSLLGGLIMAATASTSVASAAAAAAEEELISVYFGCGCFWHVQHEFVEAERKLLGRSDDAQLTARAGYAGGKAGADDRGRVCYHNAANVADYGKLGHAEVVSLQIPASKYPEFAAEYCKL